MEIGSLLIDWLTDWHRLKRLKTVRWSPTFIAHWTVAALLMCMYVCLWYIDVDECRTSENNCRYACKNIVGSFVCICPDGYEQIGLSDVCEGTNLLFKVNKIKNLKSVLIFWPDFIPSSSFFCKFHPNVCSEILKCPVIWLDISVYFVL